MQFLMNLFSTIVRILLRLAMLVVGIIFALVLLCVGLLGLLYVLLKALLTGRRPVFMTTFMQFRQASQQFKPRSWSTRQSANDDPASTREVIEGESVEVRDDTALPHKPEAPRH